MIINMRNAIYTDCDIPFKMYSVINSSSDRMPAPWVSRLIEKIS